MNHNVRKNVVILMQGIFLFALAVGLIVVFTQNMNSVCKEGDHQSRCLISILPEHAVLILVDTTDKLSSDEINRITENLQLYLYQLPTGIRVSVAAISGESGSVIRPEFVGYLPKSPQQFNPWTENLQVLNERRNTAIGLILDSVNRLDENSNVSKSSPILETLARAVRRPQFSDAIRFREIVIYSDFMQNSPYYCAYCNQSIELDRLTEFRNGLVGISLRPIMLVRGKHKQIQNRLEKEFWIPYFDKPGIQFMQFDRI